MPVYNSGEYLKTAVESVLSQSLKEIELILVDDGSTDGSSKNCDEYARHDNRVVVVHQKNGGICNARNAALKIARGEYIAFCDHDDMYLPDLLKKSYERAKQDDADLLKFCKKEFIMINDVTVKTRETHLNDYTYHGDEIRDNYFSFLNKMVLDCVWDGLFRKTFLTEHDILFDERYKAGGEDIEIITRIFIHAKIFSTMSECFYYHYIRQGFSTSAKYNPIKLQTARLLAERITLGAQQMGIKLEKHKVKYVFQMMLTYFNGTASLLQKPQNKMKWHEKKGILKELSKAEFLPPWTFEVSTCDIMKKSLRYGIAYFFYKHRMYGSLLYLAEIRNKSFHWCPVKTRNLRLV